MREIGISFELVKNSGSHRYYECNQPLTKDIWDTDIGEEITCVCVSDSPMNGERLVFPVRRREDKFDTCYLEIAGFSSGRVFDDEEYFKALALANNYEYIKN